MLWLKWKDWRRDLRKEWQRDLRTDWRRDLKKDWLLNRRKDWQRDFEFQPKNGVQHDLQNLFRKKLEMRLHELQSPRLGMRKAKEIEEKQERDLQKDWLHNLRKD